MITRGDKLLILLIILISIFSLYMIKNNRLYYEQKTVVIKVDGEIYDTIDIVKGMIPVNVKVNSQFGYNLVNIDESGVRVLEASCKDKIDVKQGDISNVGEIIVCLPNRVTIEIVGNSDLQLDGVSG